MVYAVTNNPGYDVFGRVRSMVENLRIAAEQRIAYSRTVRELSRLTESELADIGIARDEIAEIAQTSVYGA